MKSKLRELLTETTTMNQYPGQFRGAPVFVELSEVSEPLEMDIRTEYKLTLRVGAHFICNTAEYDFARENAEAQLQHHLFSAFRGHLLDAISAIHAGQEHDAMRAVKRALTECTR